MANDAVQNIVNKYGGNFGGNGVASAPYTSNPNAPQVFFDAATNQHYTLDKGQPKPLASPANKGQNIFQKVGAVAEQTFGFNSQNPSFLQTAIIATGGYVLHTAQDIGKAALGTFQTFSDLRTQPQRLEMARKFSEDLDTKQERLQQAYGAGKVSKEDYTRELRGLNRARQEINQRLLEPIVKGPTAQVRAKQIVETAVNALTLGRYKPIESGIKAVGTGFVLKSQPQKELGQVLFTAGKSVEDALQKIPAFRDLVARNTGYFLDQSVKQVAGESTSQFLARNTKNIAIGLLVKRPILYQTNIGVAEDFYNHILDGNYGQALKDAAWMGAQAVSGGPLGWAARNTKRLAGKVRALSLGKGSFIDEISKGIADGSPAQGADFIAKNAKAAKVWRLSQEVNLRIANEDPGRAAQNVLTWYDQHGIPRESITFEQLTNDMGHWEQADAIAQKLSNGVEGVSYVAVRWDKAAKEALAAHIEAAGDDFKAMTDALSELASQPLVGWGNNPILMARIANAIRDAESAAEAAQKIRQIATVSTLAKDIPPTLAKKLAKLGYSIAEPFGGRKTPKVDFKDTRRLVSSVANGSDIFDETVASQPTLAGLANMLRKYGATPESNTNIAYDKLAEALAVNLDRLDATGALGVVGDDTAKGAKYILSRLQQYVNKQAPNPYLNIGTLGRGNQSALQDIRQMNLKEIQEALLDISKETAKKLQQAILKSYTDVPLEFRGLGIKAFDYAYRVPGAKTYFRIQSALRYTYNPFFRTQEVLETKALSHLKASNLVWMKPKAELDRVAQVLDDSKIFTTGYTGEATQDLTVGRLHANLLKTQRRDLAGLALDIAERKGTTVEKLVQDNPEELADALRVVVQYPAKGVLNSPLARTLNIAFFPMRYNLKVAGIVAKEVAKLPPTVQTAFIHSMFKMRDWFKSPEGIQWQSDHSDAIQLFSYFLPTQNVASVLHLLSGKPNSIGELGLLGGLPFGVISQILDAEGIIHLNTPYVDPKTGSVLPDYVPQTTKARAAVAVQGLLNSMFTYPGRVIGLPGKSQFIRDQVRSFIDTGNGEYLKQIRTEDLTPLQRRWIQVLGDPNVSQDKIDELFTSPAPGMFEWYTLPPNNLPKPVKVLTRTEVLQTKANDRGSAPRRKKALPIPAPGQSL